MTAGNKDGWNDDGLRDAGDEDGLREAENDYAGATRRKTGSGTPVMVGGSLTAHSWPAPGWALRCSSVSRWRAVVIYSVSPPIAHDVGLLQGSTIS